MRLHAELKEDRAAACEALEAKLPARKLQKLARRLKRIVKQLWSLLPLDAQDRRKGFDSGVR